MLRIIGLVLVIKLLSSTVDGFNFDLGCGCAPPPPPPCAPLPPLPPPPPPPPLLQLPNYAICPPPPVCPILASPATLPPLPTLPTPPPLVASPCNPLGLWSLPAPAPLFPQPRFAAPAPNGYAQAPQPFQSPGPPPPGPPPVSGYSVAAHPAFLFITPDQPPQQMPPVPPPVTFDAPANTSRTRFSLAAARAATTKKQQDGNVIVTENCSNEQLRQLIVDNNDGIMASTKQIIQAIAETKFGGRFDVFCSKGDFSYTANTQLYCQAERNGFSCLAYQQLS